MDSLCSNSSLFPVNLKTLKVMATIWPVVMGTFIEPAWDKVFLHTEDQRKYLILASWLFPMYFLRWSNWQCIDASSCLNYLELPDIFMKCITRYPEVLQELMSLLQLYNLFGSAKLVKVSMSSETLTVIGWEPWLGYWLVIVFDTNCHKQNETHITVMINPASPVGGILWEH